jgi:hypothetical protein
MIFKRHVLARQLSDLLPLVLLGALGLYSVWPWLPLPRRVRARLPSMDSAS